MRLVMLEFTSALVAAAGSEELQQQVRPAACLGVGRSVARHASCGLHGRVWTMHESALCCKHSVVVVQAYCSYRAGLCSCAGHCR
jgi:hypothetical protein